MFTKIECWAYVFVVLYVLNVKTAVCFSHRHFIKAVMGMEHSFEKNECLESRVKSCKNHYLKK